MRAAMWITGLVVWLLPPAMVRAQTGGDATVKVPAAAIRGGPSIVYPVTAYLRQGQPVHIVKDSGEFLAITPPTGSSSWIVDRSLKHQQTPGRGQRTIAVVMLDDVVPRVGTIDNLQPTNVETTPLKRGTLVYLTGDSAQFENALWYRIQTPPAEVRYVSRQDVTSPSPASVVAARPDPSAVVSQRQMPALWCQAEQAERAGNPAQADLLYRQLAGQMALPGGDPYIATLCWNRIDQLGRRYQLTPWPARQQAPGVLTSSRPAAPSVTPDFSTSAQVATVRSGPGWLRRSGVTIESRAAYALEDDAGRVRYYVVPQAGLNIEAFVNRPVEVFGPMVARADMAGGGYLSVGRLHLLR
jgi:SH3-like domain-containing protein